MRGTQPVFLILVRCHRFIPAHAGNTRAAQGRRNARPVHPRACGEHLSAWPTPLTDMRFIPAHAGNTVTSSSASTPATVHPRACGEHVLPRCIFGRSSGSSPRMRGTPRGIDSYATQERFIPAHAGNTLRGAGKRRKGPVHPRACGEHRQPSCQMKQTHGSSPRMRGTLVAHLVEHKLGRFIPAHAGNTRRCGPYRWPCPVHPRACGEHSASMQTDSPPSGSSPRMRGTRLDTDLEHIFTRFIPAHAGNTLSSAAPSSVAPVHPRACGEHGGTIGCRRSMVGSSPRMRGTRSVFLAAGEQGRFIPAHAGNTRCKTTHRAPPTVHPRACGEH